MKIEIDTNIETIDLKIKVKDLRDIVNSLYFFHDYNNFSSIFRRFSRYNLPEDKEKWIKECVVEGNISVLVDLLNQIQDVQNHYKENFPLEALYAVGRDTLAAIDKNQKWIIERQERQ